MPRIPVAQRRRDFIDAAVEVIATHGIDGATTRRIAEQAKANVAMLHYCYDSKEDLFADVYEFVSGKYRELLTECDPSTGLRETARQLLRAVMEFYLASPSFTTTTMELITWARRQHGDRGIAVYDEAIETSRALLREAGAGQGVPKRTIDEAAYVIATLSDGFAVNFLTYGDAAAAKKQMKVSESVLDSWLAAKLDPVPA